MNLASIIERLTCGVFGRALDLKLEHNREKFWTNHLISRMGFINADRTNHRFFRYFEICRHVDLAAWDQRSLWARIYVDVRKHLADQFSRPGDGGIFDINYEAPIFSKFNDRLEKLKTVIDNFDNILRQNMNSDEYIFHKFLEENPIVLDSYGMIDSKPRFEYPEGEGPLGKTSVIPDFIIRLPGRRYKIVEIEKANKQTARADGVPSAKLTQPAFQIAEFKDYVRNYYYLLKDKYPGISTNCTYMLVMGRSVEDSVSEPSMEARRKDLLRQTFAVDEVYTYDDVLKNVRELYLRLSSIGGAAAS